MTDNQVRLTTVAFLSLCAAISCGCASRPHPATASVASAWQGRHEVRSTPGRVYRERTLQSDGSSTDSPIATVNGRPIARRRLVDVLLASHGLSALEQLVGLETAVAAATARGLVVGDADVEAEYDRSLRRLSDPLSTVSPGPFDRGAAEQLLDKVLAQRNTTREAFRLVIRRNAYLRRIVESRQTFTDPQLRREFDRLYGRRAEVRHIQLASLSEVERVKARLAAGEDFSELAARYSANPATGRTGGLLTPISAMDDELPLVLREVAFSLEPGEVSDAVRVGSWHHLLRLEKFIPAEERDFRQLRESLKRSLQERMGDEAMFELYEKLFRDATIDVLDPALKRAFDNKYPDRQR